MSAVEHRERDIEPWAHNPARALGGRKNLSVKDGHRYVVAQLRARREDMGLTQEQLGRSLGVTGALVSLWERGLTSPTLGSVLRWSRALDCIVQIRRVG